MWSDRYDRDLEDVFAIQEEIARKIVDALRVELSDEEDRELATPGTTDVEAYDLFLRGRALFFRATAASHRVARDLFTQALTLDPNFAHAHAFLAYFYVWDSLYHQAEPDALDKAVASAERALTLDENLAEGHVAIGYAASVRKQSDEADRAFKRALDIAPDLYEAHYYQGRSFFSRGDKERALKSFERASAVNPDDYQASVLIAQVHREAGRGDIAELSAAVAAERCKKAARLHPEDVRAVYLCAGALIDSGCEEEAKEWIDRAIGLAPNDVGVTYNAACTYSRLNLRDEAVRYLARTIELGFNEKTWIEHDSDFDNVREHPGYKEIISNFD
jgi:adenylate cyclase